MGYCDEFYKKDNILGYTGDLMDKPTVYFADAGALNPRTVEVNGQQQVLATSTTSTSARSIERSRSSAPGSRCCRRV